MAVGLFLLILLVVGGCLLVGTGAAAYAINRNSQDAERIKSLRADLKSALSESRVATKALRSIANGAGNPILEATDALDSINNNDIKELN